MLRRIFVYGFLAVAGVGVISMAGVLRNRAAVQADGEAPYAVANNTACCASAKCAGASACCAGTKCEGATSCPLAENCSAGPACSTEADALACSAVETENGVCQAVQFGQTIVGIPVDDDDDLSQRPCGINLMRAAPSGEAENSFNLCSGDIQNLVLAVDPSQVNLVDRQLQVVQKLLAKKAELAPSEAQIKAAIDNYFLVNKVESAIQVLMKIITEAPESEQAKKAKVAIGVLQGTDSVQPEPNENSESESPIPVPPVPMP